jgi:hypothetical protein
VTSLLLSTQTVSGCSVIFAYNDGWRGFDMGWMKGDLGGL